MSDPSSIVRRVLNQERALKGNLLTSVEVKGLYEGFKAYCDTVLTGDGLPALRYRKNFSLGTVWVDQRGYPISSAWPKFEVLLGLLAQHEAERTIKRKLKTDGLFVESRSRGEDQHLLIGRRDGSGEKAHIVIDGKTAEIRVEDNRLAPEEVVHRIETILTLADGRKVRTTRELLEEIEEEKDIDGGYF